MVRHRYAFMVILVLVSLLSSLLPPVQPVAAASSAPASTASPTHPGDATQADSAGGLAPSNMIVAALPSTSVIYDDALSADWMEFWSWDSVLDEAVANPHYSGSLSYGVQYTGGWAGLRLAPVVDSLDLRSYQTLRFAIHGGTAGGQQVRVVLDTSTDYFTLDVVTAGAGQWTLVEIPLPSNAALAEVTELVWQEHTNQAQPIFYLDQIELVGSGTEPSPTPTSPVTSPTTATSTNTPTAAVTNTPTATPAPTSTSVIYDDVVRVDWREYCTERCYSDQHPSNIIPPPCHPASEGSRELP